MSGPGRPRQRLSPDDYQYLRSHGYSDDDIQADGYDLPFGDVSGGGSSSAPGVAAPKAAAADAANALPPSARPTGGRPADFFDELLQAVSLGGMARAQATLDALGERPMTSADRAMWTGKYGAPPELPSRPEGESFRDSRERNLADRLQGLRTFRADHPLQTVAADVVGALLPTLVTGGAAAPEAALGAAAKESPSAVARAMIAAKTAAKSAGTAAAMSGITRFNESTGDVGDRLSDAEQAAIWGGLFGLGLPLVFQGAGRLAKSAGVASEGMNRDQAGKLLLRAIESDDLAAPDLVDRARVLQALDQSPNVAELGGENVRGLVQLAQGVPGKGAQRLKTAYEGRMKALGPGVQRDVAETFGATPDNLNDIVDAIVEARKSAAGPLYAEAFADNALVSDPAVQAHLHDPAFKRAYARAQVMATRRGEILPQLYDEKGMLVRNPDVRTINYLKKGLDDVIQIGRRDPDQLSGLTKENIVTLKAMQKDMLDAADKVKPVYAEARQVYEGGSRLRDAVTEGYDNFGTLSSDDLQTMLRDMTAGEREMFRFGAMKRVLEEAKNASAGLGGRARDVPSAVFGNQNITDKLRALLTPEEYAQLEQRIGGRNAVVAVRNAMQGSRTAPMLLRNEDAANQLAADVATKGPVNAMAAFATRNLNRFTKGLSGPVAAEVADMALTEGDDLPRLVAELLMQRAASRRPGYGSYLGGTLGSHLGDY